MIYCNVAANTFRRLECKSVVLIIITCNFSTAIKSVFLKITKQNYEITQNGYENQH